MNHLSLLKTGAFSIACAALMAGAQERSPFGAPALSTNAQITGGQASTQINAGQVANPLLLNLSGAAVKDESGQQLGQIQHLIVSPQGCVDMAVLSLGGVKLVPVPWQLVDASAANAGTIGTVGAPAGRIALKLNVDRQKLHQAPSFSMNQISQITQQQTIQQVYNFYGLQQNQNVGGSSTQSGTITGGTSSTNVATSGTQTNQFGTTGQARSQTPAATNQFGATSTNQFGVQGSATNRSEVLSPTGRTNGYPIPPSVGNTNVAPARPIGTPGIQPTNAPRTSP